jgi:hypothetical protein
MCLWVCQCIPLSLLGNNSVKTFPRQRRIVGGVVFYAVRVISKENGRLVLLRTACNIIFSSSPWSPTFRFSDQNFCAYHFHACCVPLQSQPSSFDHLIIMSGESRLWSLSLHHGFFKIYCGDGIYNWIVSAKPCFSSSVRVGFDPL